MCSAIDIWRDKHNHHRLHRTPGYLPPKRAVEVPNGSTDIAGRAGVADKHQPRRLSR